MKIQGGRFMKAALWYGRQDLRVMEVPNPVPANDEVVIKVMRCGICGTDLHIIADEYAHTPPIVLGHEFTGVIEACGGAVKGL